NPAAIASLVTGKPSALACRAYVSPTGSRTSISVPPASKLTATIAPGTAVLYQSRMLARIRVVLVRPRPGGNVGSVARALENMGLPELVLVAPRTPVGATAERLAAPAGDVLPRRRVVLRPPAS